MKIQQARIHIIALLFVVFASGCASRTTPLYLTWQGDTSTTMTVNYLTRNATSDSTVYFDTEPRGGVLDQYRHRATGASHTIPDLPVERNINVVELTGLEPGARYYFVAGDPGNGFTPEHSFRTIPRDGTPLRFIAGGDMSILPREKLLLQQAAPFNPMFAVIGGDIAYANGKLSSYYLWDIWIKRWSQIMVTEDGTLVPLVLAIGNHEVNKKEGPQEERAPYFFHYFPQGGKSYFARTFGANLAMIILDTDHLVHHADQRDWLEAQLLNYQDYPVKMAVYHIPLYPSVREFDADGSTAGREYWLPLFDQHRLTAGWENHDHAFKRSKPLRAGEVHPEGTLYLGDGAFGVKTRQVPQPLPWYLEKASGTAHFWVVDVSEEEVSYKAVNSSGEIIDEVEQAIPATATP